jgi:hypothetical protein
MGWITLDDYCAVSDRVHWLSGAFLLGGYAWQVAHYLLGLRALGHAVWFLVDNHWLFTRA